MTDDERLDRLEATLKASTASLERIGAIVREEKERRQFWIPPELHDAAAEAVGKHGEAMGADLDTAEVLAALEASAKALAAAERDLGKAKGLTMIGPNGMPAF